MSGSPWRFATWHQTMTVWVFGNNHSNLLIRSDFSSDKKAERLHKLMGCKNSSYSPEPVKHIVRQPYLWLHSHRYSLTSQILITAAKLMKFWSFNCQTILHSMMKHFVQSPFNMQMLKRQSSQGGCRGRGLINERTWSYPSSNFSISIVDYHFRRKWASNLNLQLFINYPLKSLS